MGTHDALIMSEATDVGCESVQGQSVSMILHQPSFVLSGLPCSMVDKVASVSVDLYDSFHNT